MSDEPRGKYDEEGERVLVKFRAAATVLIVLGGVMGPGFSVSAIDPLIISEIPKLLRKVADAIEGDSGNIEMYSRQIKL